MNKVLKLKISIFLIISLMLCGSLFFSKFFENTFGLNQTTPTGESGFRVVYADVGQGDMTLIETGRGDVILIDSSTSKEKTKVNKFLQQELLDKDKTTIDYVIVTHPDEDHIGNMVLVFDLFAVEACYLPNVSYTTSKASPLVRKDDDAIDNKFNGFTKLVNTGVYKNLLLAVQNENDCEAKWYSQNETLDLKDETTVFKFLSEPILENHPESDVNDYSPIMMLTHAGKKFMFTGDANSKIEKRFLDSASSSDLSNVRNIDVYKAGHHGSDGSSSKELLLAINPKVVLVSAGKDNPYKHPAAAFVQRVASNTTNAEILITFELGNIVCLIENGNLKVDNLELSMTNDMEWWHVVIGLVILSGAVIFTSEIAGRRDRQKMGSKKRSVVKGKTATIKRKGKR